MSANTRTPGTGGMSDFDRLPPKIRAALREFPLNMDSGFALLQIRQGVDEARLLKMLETKRAQLGPFNQKE